MSVKYIPVQWNPNKWIYDGVVLACMALYLWVFLTLVPMELGRDGRANGQIHNMRAFGSLAFLMLTVILCLGPLARLDERFLPLIYNRRHFGVLTALVALTHFGFVMDWYYAFSPTPRPEALLTSNTTYDRVLGFPFEILGVIALIILLVLAATSHDFWLKFLKPRLWKRLHFLIYPAYLAVIAHVTLGALQSRTSWVFAAITLGSAVLVSGLHLLTIWRERGADPVETEWVAVCPPGEISDGFARIVYLGQGERVAVFRAGDTFSAISNACAHQNGPLGEGRIIDGCVTCPWHGFQYRVADGRSPEPFTEKVPTYRLRLEGEVIEVNRAANPPGTYVEPIRLSEVAT